MFRLGAVKYFSAKHVFCARAKKDFVYLHSKL